jgi:acyl dehydratase
LAAVQGISPSPIWKLPPDTPHAQTEAAAMRFHAYQDDQQSAHLDIIFGTRTIDLITVTVAAMLVAGFVAALAAELIW